MGPGAVHWLHPLSWGQNTNICLPVLLLSAIFDSSNALCFGTVRNGSSLEYLSVPFFSGYWYMHCHTAFHNEVGMALYLKVGEPKDMNAPPSQLNKCGNFDWSEKDASDRLDKPISPGT